MILLIYLTTVSNYYTQVTSSDIKTNVHINIKNQIVPPVIKVSEINFIDENLNNTVDAFESNNLSFLITNTGPGHAIGMVAEVKITGTTDGITCKKNHIIPSIETGEKQEFSIPLTSSRFTTNGIIKLEISIVEPNGFSPESFFVEIKTQAFRAPKLEIVDYSTSMNTWWPNSPVGFDVLLQNTGQYLAENINVNLILPNSINCYSNNISLNIHELSPSESVRISYDILVPRNFNKDYVDAYINVTEKFGDYGASWSHEFPFEQLGNNENTISIQSSETDSGTVINRASMYSSSAEIRINVDTTLTNTISKVAVIGKEGTLCDGSHSTGQSGADIVQSELIGLYSVVERKYLEDILQEQRLAMSGLILQDSDLAQAGCLAGAQGTVLVSYGCFRDKTKFQITLVDCSTSDIYWSATATGVNVDEYELLDSIKMKLAK